MNPRLHDWSGKVVWLVGASSGIGRATASALHARGAKVIVSARSAAALQQFTLENPGAVAMPLDVTDAVAARATAEAIVSAHGLHCLVYCAGHYNEMSAQSFDLASLKQHVQVNYVGVLNVLDAVLPHLLNQSHNDGAAATRHISLVGSVAGYVGLPKSLAYGPTKAALINLAETLYLDLHPEGIGVSLVSPGFVDTPLTTNNQFKMPALISPVQAAEAILLGWSKGRFEIHFPKRFTFWLKLLRLLPYRVALAATRRLTQT